ncbi:MAG TPA: immunoglobulin domain-containing protein [Verrucomicrobiae bacterium]|nr:immunoglobulin domain-containing protein [Verrucomicrobiae bacterium]
MKHVIRSLFVVAAILSFATPSRAVVILDDTWADGNRNNTSLPTNAAWYTSTSGSLTATTGSMTLSLGSGANLAVSYFTTNASAPVQLSVGDTLLTTITFVFNGLASQNSSLGFPLGIYEFGSNRVSADFSGNQTQGAGVQGYALFQNMGTTFNNASPMSVMERTSVSDSDLLGHSADYTSLGTGPGNTNNFSGFVNGTTYTLQLSLQRTTTNAMVISVTWVNTSTGASLSTAAVDTSATNFNFDGIGLRPASASKAASTIQFEEVKVEYIAGSTPPSITTDPQDQQVYTNQPASFSVLASGTQPLFYQWLYNSNTVLTNATSSSLTISNAQLTDAGGYSAIVSNAYGIVTSAVAQLSVTIPDPPTIIMQPQDQTVIPGDTATFTVQAGGSEPFSYQWYDNTSTLIAGATDSTLTLTNVQPSAAGPYFVVVSNLAGSITSSSAMLSLNTNPVAPVFTSQPVSLTVVAGSVATFGATVIGTAPISYQWYTNGVALVGATSSTLTLSNAQASADAGYTLIAANSAGSATSQVAVLTVTATVPIPNSAYNLVGFGQGTTGGGVLADTDPNYAKVYTATDLANALSSKTVKIIEIMNDLNLGYNEIEASAKVNSEPFRADTTPKLHPVLIQTGVSLIDVQKKNGLTIFSANGSTIRHAHLNIKNGSNIIVRNLRFDQLWEWDEASKGNYDENNWDFMTIGDSGSITGLWIDHCTFTKAYDGITDIKNGSAGITISWCKYTGDDGATNPNSFVWQQINALESNRTSYAMYNALRTAGFSTTDIVTIIQGHDKTHLIGANDLDSNNALHTVTLHHEWFINPWDRLPRLRAGNVHDYNIYVDDTVGLAAKNLRNQHTFSSSYSFNPFLNGTISTENGATLVEKSVYIDCVTPLRNNQTNPSDPRYTGKIEAIDCIYHFDNSNGTTTDYRGDSTNATGFALFGPAQAPVIAFSWNLTGNQLPYTYYPDDPSQLKAIVTSPTAGAGAGVLTWNKTNWLVTSYAPTGPIIVTSPQSQTVAAGQSASFTVVASGSAPLFYQWYFNSTTPISNATSASLTVTNVQSGNVGSYSVVVSNGVNAATSSAAALTIQSSATPPVASFTATPTSGLAPLAVNFTDNSTGSITSSAWTFGDGGTASFAAPTNITYTYVSPGTYTVTLVATGPGGSNTSTQAGLITVLAPFTAWQQSYFNYSGNPAGAPNADPLGKGISNTNQFLLGLNPTNPASVFAIISVSQSGGTNTVVWKTSGGDVNAALFGGPTVITNIVQGAVGAAGGGYSNNFSDVSGPMIIVPAGDTVTNYSDAGGTNLYYRIRLGP